MIPAVRRAEVLDDALLEQLLHGLAAVAGGDAVVVLVGDDRDVANRRGQLLGSSVAPPSSVCEKMMTSPAGT